MQVRIAGALARAVAVLLVAAALPAAIGCPKTDIVGRSRVSRK